MKMITTIFSLLLSSFCLIAQEKGAVDQANNTFALVVGVSNYQDPEIPDLKFAQRDAEAFAAFLQSKSGGEVPKKNIKLLTSSEATIARFSTALDWLFEQSILADRVIIYIAGYGDTELSGRQSPGYFLLADSPLTPLQAGAFEIEQIASVLDNIFYKREPNFLFIANLSPFILPAGIDYEPVKLPATQKTVFANSLYCKFISPADLKKSPLQISEAKFTLNHLLLDGLLGFADKDKDMEVSFWEMKRFFRKATPIEQRWPGMLFLSVGMRKHALTLVDATTFEKLELHHDRLSPSIVHMETTEREDKILENTSEKVYLMYQDFILSIKLAHLLTPEDRCASYFYEQLKTEPDLEKLHNDMRRKLAAALLDEVQQALNAYLKLDNSELERRSKSIDPYQRYADYMARAIELFGQKSFMSKIMKAKYHYFNGLVARMKGVIYEQPDMLDLAITEQLKALEYESAAAFIQNEIGVVYSLKGELDQASDYFEMAIEYSPNWGIPYSNLCIIWTQKKEYEKAIKYGKEAFRLSPRNILVTGTLANAYHEWGDLNSGARLWDIILQKDPYNNLALYNKACIKSLQGDKEAALSLLEQALQYGFKNWKNFHTDSDLDPIRKDPRYASLQKRFFSDQAKE